MIRPTKPTTDGSMPLAFSYVRFSSTRQSHGHSLERQLELARQYAIENGLMLDDLSFQDLGVSAFCGKNKTEGALGAFLKATESGRVPKGSWLLVESLDRLSREEVEEALTLFLTIIRAGIKIVTLLDRMVFEKGQLDMGKLVLAIAYMSRGNNESTTKSDRLSKLQEKNRTQIANGKHARIRTPGWLMNDDNRFVFRPERVKIVREMVASLLAGKSTVQIKHDLNTRKVPTFSHGKKWASSSIHFILTNPALIGEFHPVSGRDPKPNYFPAVLDVTTFRKVLALLSNNHAKPLNPTTEIRLDPKTGELRAFKSRGRNGGRRQSEVNLFTRLVVGKDGSRWHAKLRGNSQRQNRVPYLVNEMKTDANEDVLTFPYFAFEGTLLACLSELDPAAFASRDVSRERRDLDGMRDELAEINGRIAETQARIESGKNFTSLLNVLERLEERKAVLIGEIAKAERSLMGAETADVKAVHDCLAVLEQAKGDKERQTRDKLRGMIRTLVDRVEVGVFEMTVPNIAEGGMTTARYCVAEVHFQHGGSRRVVMRASRKFRTGFALDAVWNFGKETDWQAVTDRPVPRGFFDHSERLAKRVAAFAEAVA